MAAPERRWSSASLCLREWKDGDLRSHRHLRRQCQERLAVVAGQVRDRPDDALAPEQVVRKRGDIAHVDAGADDRAALRERCERCRDELARRCEDDRRVELLRRLLLRVAGPLGAELARKGLARRVARLREGEDAPALRPGDLADDVRCSAEAVEAEPLGVAGQAQRPKADQASAEQRCGLEIGIAVGDRKAEALVRDRLLGIASVDRVAGEARVVAEVLAARPAVAAAAARPAEPGNADPLARSRTESPRRRRRERARRSGGRARAAASARRAPRRRCAGRCGRRRRRCTSSRTWPGPGVGLRQLGLLQRPADSGEEHGAQRRGLTLLARARHRREATAVGNPQRKKRVSADGSDRSQLGRSSHARSSMEVGLTNPHRLTF